MEKFKSTGLNEKIGLILSEELNPLECYQKVILLCNQELSNLRDKVVKQGFLSQRDEVLFFKKTKQVPLVNLIYYTELRNLEINFPKNGYKNQKKILKHRIKEIRKFHCSQAHFFKYIRLNQCHLDHVYFTRNDWNSSYFTESTSYIIDPVFHTSHDSLLAKLKAFEKLNVFLFNKLSSLEKTTTSNSLKWTSSKVSLTELIYALYHSKSINNGRADIKEIAKVFQDTLNIDLSDLYRTFSEIRNRKKGHAKYLNELAYTLQEKMKFEDS